MDFLQVDVFSEGPYTGNPLAVFPESDGLKGPQMQAIAREMNLSETTFVTDTTATGYSVRIFTPTEELPFAGHPTIGTAWVLRHLDRIGSGPIVQRSGAGDTPVSLEQDEPAFERIGKVDAIEPPDGELLARGLGLPNEAIGATVGGRSLTPAFADAGIPQLMVPIDTTTQLVAAAPLSDVIESISHHGVYCFAAVGPGHVKARGFFPGVGIAEDPATGSAAAALGLYLADRVGSMTFEIAQGAEIGRPSRIKVAATPDNVTVAGRCELIFTGTLSALP
jgi:trans-2,3-dihydro-3-hydroxyanthranilate isomerase